MCDKYWGFAFPRDPSFSDFTLTGTSMVVEQEAEEIEDDDDEDEEEEAEVEMIVTEDNQGHCQIISC